MLLIIIIICNIVITFIYIYISTTLKILTIFSFCLAKIIVEISVNNFMSKSLRLRLNVLIYISEDTFLFLEFALKILSKPILDLLICEIGFLLHGEKVFIL